MQIKSAEFVKSSAQVADCPSDGYPEYAFIGRSNVGKSSLINLLTGRKKLAKTSATPGKTQLINHFKINDTWYIVDLPGYGWAKTSKVNKAAWKKMIDEYLEKSQQLACVMVLIDCRHEPQTIDVQFMEWLGEHGIPFVIVFTKTDKLTQPKLDKNIAAYKKHMQQQWEELPDMFLTSSADKSGGEEILQFIDRVNAEIYR